MCLSVPVCVCLCVTRDLVNEGERLPARLDALDDLNARIRDAQYQAARITPQFPFKPSRRFARHHTLVSLAKAEALVVLLDDAGVVFAEGERVRGYVEAAKDWIHRYHAALADSATGVAEFQALMTEASRIPIDLSQYKDAINDKLSAAAAWLAKVRNAVPKKRTRGGQEMMELSNLQELIDVR